MKHSYQSAEYFAQEFQKFLLGYSSRKFGGNLPIKHSGTGVSGKISGVEFNLEFKVEGEKLSTELEVVNPNGDRFGPMTSKLEILRSKTDRVSSNMWQHLCEQYEPLFIDFVLPELRKAYLPNSK